MCPGMMVFYICMCSMDEGILHFVCVPGMRVCVPGMRIFYIFVSPVKHSDT